MTPEAKQIAIAEACGWKPYSDQDFTGWQLTNDPNTFAAIEDLPDYLNDLNAMHSAVQSLGLVNRSHFQRELNKRSEEKHCEFCDLTAQDWADCFLTSKRE